MKIKHLLLAIFPALLMQSAVLAQNWTTDFDKARTEAREQGRAIFVFFTGSDWCGWCKKLDAEVLSTGEFKSFATENLVLVKVDFPRYNPLPPAQKISNDQLAARFNVQGYPSVYVLSKEGNLVGQLGYMPGGPEAFLTRMKSFKGVEWRAGSNAGPGSPPKIVKADPTPVPLYNGAQLMPPKRFNELQLTGIMGSKKRPMVIINNQSFAVGETARVKVNDSEVKLTCKEIRSSSALVLVEGNPTPTEIFLASTRTGQPIQR
jgi:thioredoxin-related protein